MSLLKVLGWILTALLAMPALAAELTREEEAMLRQMREAAKEQGVRLTPEMERMALGTVRRSQAQVLGLQAAAKAMEAGADTGTGSSAVDPSSNGPAMAYGGFTSALPLPGCSPAP